MNPIKMWWQRFDGVRRLREAWPRVYPGVKLTLSDQEIWQAYLDAHGNIQDTFILMDTRCAMKILNIKPSR